MRSFKTEGIIIKRKNYSEADRIVTVLSKHHGKLQVKASGVRKITSRRSAHIELLNHSILTIHTGRKFPILTEAESLNDFSDIKKDLTKVGFAYHLCELIDGLCPENQENPSVFELFHSTLLRLETEEEMAYIIHEFEVELLRLLGYWHQKQAVLETFDTQRFIENILEKRLKSRRIFTKLT